MAIPSTPPILPMPIADSGDVRSIPEQTPTGTNQLSFQSGFPPITSNPLTAGGIPPQREDFNAAYKLLSQHAFFQQSGGVYPWMGAAGDFPGLNYLANAHVTGSDGKEYIAVSPSGPDIPEAVGFVGPKDPVGDDGTYWISRSNIKMTVFSSPGTFAWTKPAGHTHTYIRLCGGGGASGDVPMTGTGQFSASGGGGGGGYAEKLINDISDTVSVTVGAGGARVVGGTGQTGGTSSFGTHVSATGGTGSSYGAATSFGVTSATIITGTGGAGVGGDININGGDGCRNIVFSNNVTYRNNDSGGACAMFGIIPIAETLTVPGQGARGQVQLNQNANSAGGIPGNPGMVEIWSW